MQYLLLPINSFKPTAGYKSKKYSTYWEFAHYGVDCVTTDSNRALYGLGDGVVAAAGLDGLNGNTTGKNSGCGYCLVVIYKDCYNWQKKKAYDVVVTYMHMKTMPKVKKGDKVTRSTYLGDYGNTGANTTGPHLHAQFDTDINYPLYCCGLSSKGHNLLKKGTVDSTLDPVGFFHIGEKQDISVPSSAWYERTDFLNIPKEPNSAPVVDRKETVKTTSNGKVEIIKETKNGITTFYYKYH